VQIKLPARRVISLSWDAAEVIRAIGAADRLVGVNSTVAKAPTFWGKLSQLPQIGGAFEPNCEVIGELHPDLVIAYEMRPDKTFEEKMAKFGIPVVRLDCFRPERMTSDVRALGQVLECNEGAERLAGFIEKWGLVVEERLREIPAEKRPRVYVEGYGDFRGNGPGTGGHSMCLLAGGRNIVESLGAKNPTVSSEWVIEQNPDVILKAVSSSEKIAGYGAPDDKGMKGLRDQIAARAGWDRIAAVRDGRVCLVSAHAWLGPAYVAGELQLAKWFYPALFADVDPQKVLADYLKTFHGLEAAGVLFYP
jgi:iron complex transport system substrate-binding protein